MNFYYRCYSCGWISENNVVYEVCKECGSSIVKDEYDPELYKHKKQYAMVSCPYCKSTNTSKISTLGRITSIGLLGFGSSKIGKQWHCNNCKSDF